MRNSLTVNVISDSAWWRTFGVAFSGGGHGQEGVREHGQGGPAVPGGPAPDLVLVEAGEALGGLEGFLDASIVAQRRAPRSFRGTGSRAVAAQVGQLPGAVVAANQQVMVSGVAVGSSGAGRPAPTSRSAAPLAPDPALLLPGPCGQCGRRAGRRGSARPRWGLGGWPRPRTHSPARGRGWPRAGRVGAIDLVAGHPPRRDVRGHRAVDQSSRQCRFGREIPSVVRDSGALTAFRVLGPGFGRYRARSIRACPRRAA